MTIFNGTVAINGQGAVTISATVVHSHTQFGVLGVVGQGTVAISASVRMAGRAAIVGQGTVTASPTRGPVVWQGSVAIAGQATVSIAPVSIYHTSVAIVGQGSLGLNDQGITTTPSPPPPPPGPTSPFILIPPTPPVVNPQPSLNDYTSLIPAYNAIRPKFMATVQALLAPIVNLESFFETVPEAFDIDTAIGTQLDQVGIWIGRSREIQAPITGVFFSWDIVGLGWEQGTWQGTFDPSDSTQTLDDGTYRQLLYAKRAANGWDGTRFGIVTAIEDLFGDLNVTVQVIDNQDMTMEVDVTGQIESLIFQAILLGGYVPIKPVGVALTYNLIQGPAPATVWQGSVAVAGQGTIGITTRQVMSGRVPIAGAGTFKALGTGGSGTNPGQTFNGTFGIFGAGTVGISATVLRGGRPSAIVGVGTVSINATVQHGGQNASMAVSGRGSFTCMSATPQRVTNFIRNPGMAGVVAGTPGTPPTTWTIVDNGSGLASSIVGSGTDGVIPYIDIRLFGTTGGSGGFSGTYVIGFCDPGDGTGVNVSQSQVWSDSAYVKVQAGTLTGVNGMYLGYNVLNAGGYVNTYVGAGITPTGAALSSQLSQNNAVTMTDVVDSAIPFLAIDLNSTTAVDVTLRIGAPDMELASAVSGILIVPRAGTVKPRGAGTTFVL